eukprot:TRINITY_DN13489_c0_g1_i1.p1 TRINITY_DN13489_c0_g1~~TRINITY_DN13489_c0_g1_i1.p1  ORF type:complete len:622 (+),score=114.77 TRINITY_DN13489_c0_g1_i1:92-1957(+)
MSAMAHVLALFSVVFLWFSHNVAAASEGKLSILKLDRQINLHTQAIRGNYAFKIENKGTSPVSSVLITLPSHQAARLSDAKASSSEGKGKAKKTSLLPIIVTPSSELPSKAPSNLSFYSISLLSPLAPGSTLSLDYKFVITGLLKPFPPEISQSDPQLLLFEDSHYVLSPYPIKSQTTTITLPLPSVESYTRLEPCKLNGGTLKLGPYTDVKPFSSSALTVHYENNFAMVVVDKLVRELEVSHWGNIYVTENYRLRHAGAKHKGGFSRLDYQAKPTISGTSGLRGLRGNVPPNVRSMYYRDEIGNISTSRVTRSMRSTQLEIEPRYPLLGGWLTTFILGYSVPLEDFVKQTKDGRKVFSYNVGCPFEDVVVEDLEVKVVLPEGASGIEVRTPFVMEQFQEEKYSYLDTVGRPVVVLKRANVVGEMSGMSFEVLYEYPRFVQLGKPLLLVLVAFLFFGIFMVSVRTDLTISKHTPVYVARLQEVQIQHSLKSLQRVFAKRAFVLSSLDGTLLQLTRSGKVEAAKTSGAAAESILQATAEEVQQLAGQVEGPGTATGLSSKVQALISVEKECVARALEKLRLMVECYEAELPLHEIDEKLAPVQKRYLALKADVKASLLALKK